MPAWVEIVQDGPELELSSGKGKITARLTRLLKASRGRLTTVLALYHVLGKPWITRTNVPGMVLANESNYGRGCEGKHESVTARKIRHSIANTCPNGRPKL